MATTESNRKRKIRGKQIIANAKDQPCADCHGTFPSYVMDLDHRPGEIKLFEISSTGYYRGLAALLAEIAKCDVVCANCHRMRTHERWQYEKPQVT